MAEKEAFVPDFPCEVIKEGKVQVKVPNLTAYGVVPSDYAPSKAPVFYNPVMQFNRDISVLAFRAYQHLVDHEVSICEPMTSQGVRAIRYALEVDNVVKVVAGDINRQAYELAKYNIELNQTQNKIILKYGEANRLLSSYARPKSRFDIIDIDPFGTPVPFLDSAFRAIKNNGMLAATATDMAPLCGVHAKACLRKYSGKPLRTEYCHELAVRLLAGCIAKAAAQHDIGVQFLFSHSSDHYIRVYVQIRYGAKKADESLKQVGYIMHCFNCMHREIINQPFSCPTCHECGASMEYAGPLWTDAIADKNFVQKIIEENQVTQFENRIRIEKLLNLIKNEADQPATYYVIDKLCKKLNLPAPANQKLLEEIRKSGFEAVVTHFNSRGIKTNASAQNMQKSLRGFVNSS